MAATAKDLGGAPEGVQEALMGAMTGQGGMPGMAGGQEAQLPNMIMPEQI